MIKMKEITSFVDKMAHFAKTSIKHLEDNNVGLAKDILKKTEYASEQLIENIEKSQSMTLPKREVGNLILWEDEIAPEIYQQYKVLSHAKEKFDEAEGQHFLEFITVPQSIGEEVRL